MKKNVLQITVLFSAAALLFGCHSDPNENANKMYVEISQSLQKIQENKGSFTAEYEAYKQAKIKLNTLLADYPSSAVAVTLLSGQTKIFGLTLNQFQEKEKSMKLLADAEQSPLDAALAIVETIDKTSYHISPLLTEIAITYAEAGDKETANSLTSRSIETAKSINDSDEKANVLTEIANEYAESGQKDQAESLLSESLTIVNNANLDPSRRLGRIAIGYAKIRQCGQADKLSKMIGDIGWMKGIAGECAKARQFAHAINIAKAIKVTGAQAAALTEIGIAYAESGGKREAAQLFFQILEMIKSIENSGWKAELVAKVADGYAKIEKQGKAESLLSEAAIAADTIKGTGNNFLFAFSGKLAAMAVIYEKNNKKDEAEKMLSKAVDIANTISNDPNFMKEQALLHIVRSWAEAGRSEKVIEIAKTIKEDWWRSQSFFAIIDDIAKKEKFNQSIALAEQIEDLSWKAKALNNIEKAYIRARKQPSDADKAILREIVHSVIEVSPLFEQATQ
ncbi:MAG: hypothetical protein CDV28_11838 [Candidatus Electronema aureum]|uniref:Tetratricopeptide repeat-containing protein n=1 Tax=Candidatus Electronema aureum TaxID=2005002 RepID=A0A521G152_9BACT|nr:MAG: hypothetical protein CDV28_11838 [Candidatus Electronema aureum]